MGMMRSSRCTVMTRPSPSPLLDVGRLRPASARLPMLCTLRRTSGEGLRKPATEGILDISSHRAHMSGLANGENLTECGRNGVEGKGAVLWSDFFRPAGCFSHKSLCIFQPLQYFSLTQSASFRSANEAKEITTSGTYDHSNYLMIDEYLHTFIMAPA